MSIVYVDSSAALKRVVIEAESDSVREFLNEHDSTGDLLTSSSITWLEVWRSLRRAAAADVAGAVAAALSGIAEFELNPAVLMRARAVGGDELRSLDAIHLASAIAVGADALLTYDKRLSESAAVVGLEVIAPTH